MKVIILQENLSRGISVTGKSVSGRPQLPVLGNILLATEEGRLKFSATNLETGISFWARAKVEEEGSFTVPAKIFSEFVASLPKEKAEITQEENMLRVKCGTYEASFNGINASEFPLIPVFPEGEYFSFEAEVFTNALKKVSFAATTDEGRPVLTGVLLQFGEKEMAVVATDGYRLSKMVVPKPEEVSPKKMLKADRLLIPARALSEIVRLSLEGEEKKKIKLALLPTHNQAIFSLDEIQIVTQLLGGEFPAYEKIIPMSSSVKVTFATEDLARAVKMAAIFARENANIIKFAIAKGEMTVSSNTPQVGNNKNTLEVKGEGEGEIAFNSRYLLDLLNAVTAKEMVFEMTGALNPGVFREFGEENFVHIIMPVRVQT